MRGAQVSQGGGVELQPTRVLDFTCLFRLSKLR